MRCFGENLGVVVCDDGEVDIDNMFVDFVVWGVFDDEVCGVLFDVGVIDVYCG